MQSADVSDRLRASARQPRAIDRSALLNEAAAEIEMLRMALYRIADQDATFSVIGGNIVVDVDAKLTNAELEAIREAAGAYMDNDDDEECAKIAATLHGLLKRLG